MNPRVLPAGRHATAAVSHDPLLIRTPIELIGASGIEFVNLLRTAASQAQPVDWCSDHLTDDQVRLFEHLPPPYGCSDAAARWREKHDYGSLFFRQGPGFLSVRDQRSWLEPAAYKISDDRLRSCIEQLQRPSRHVCAQCALLDEEFLTANSDGWRLFLPIRLRFPPVPFLGV